MPDFPDYFRPELAMNSVLYVNTSNEVIGATLTKNYGDFYVGNWEALTWKYVPQTSAGMYQLVFTFYMDAAKTIPIAQTVITSTLTSESVDSIPTLGPYVNVTVFVPAAAAQISLQLFGRRNMTPWSRCILTGAKLAFTSGVIAAAGNFNRLFTVQTAGLVTVGISSAANVAFFAGVHVADPATGLPGRMIQGRAVAAGDAFAPAPFHVPHDVCCVQVFNTGAAGSTFSVSVIGEQ